ncbi:cuticle protein 7-like [Pollicipes pollicipes]|uniref:cuticle protein 7-like n=1 Tax=Pollicipes pollicipes TaxID=41117 RepID=UPI00188571AF|nr:cuticle protein 7-like [Pollicipes pollicipes]
MHFSGYNELHFHLQVFVLVAALAAAVAAAPAPDAPSYHPEYQYKEPKPFAYDYFVSDHYTGTNFVKKEESDGHNTQGYYSVALPDGRIQHVKYVVDKYGGYNAEVTYEGEAQYPEPAPAYKPASHHPEPKYNEEAKPFAYDYAVNDHYSGANFANKEETFSLK